MHSRNQFHSNIFYFAKNLSFSVQPGRRGRAGARGEFKAFFHFGIEFTIDLVPLDSLAPDHY